MTIDIVPVILDSYYVGFNAVIRGRGKDVPASSAGRGTQAAYVPQQYHGSVISKLADETDDEIVGYSVPHCVAFKIPLFRRGCNIGNLLAKIPCRWLGGCILSKVSLSA